MALLYSRDASASCCVMRVFVSANRLIIAAAVLRKKAAKESLIDMHLTLGALFSGAHSKVPLRCEVSVYEVTKFFIGMQSK
jgi:hypothetical protein